MSAPTLADRLLDFVRYVETHPTVDEPGVVAAYVLVRASDVDTIREAASALSLSDAERAERERLARNFDDTTNPWEYLTITDCEAIARVLRGQTALGGNDG